MRPNRVTFKRALPWAIAPLLCLVLYWHGLKAWFQMDDFAWLGLHTHVRDWPSFFDALFRPMAQGTVRPLSERLFFLAFWQWFGMEALPYRILVFLTQFANLTLITLIVRRLTASKCAGVLASVFWLLTPVLYLPMTWTSAYNQILSTFFLLTQTYCLILWTQTGLRRYYALMWVAFLIGFGALELNLVFPGIAVLYVALFATHRILAVLPTGLISVGYFLWHRAVTRPMRTSTYALDFRPQSMAATAWEYLRYSVTAVNLSGLGSLSESTVVWCGLAALLVMTAALLWMLTTRGWLAIFFLGWFFITLAPYLPLTAHVSDYYLTAPTVGLAMLAGWGTVLAWRSTSLAKVVAVTGTLCFVIPCAWQGWEMSRSYSEKSRRVRSVLRGVAAVRARNPNKMILLAGVDDDVFWHGLYDQPERALGWPMLYLTQTTQQMLVKREEREFFNNRFLPDALALKGIRDGSIVVYDVGRRPIRNVTAAYRQLLAANAENALPTIIDFGNPLYQSFLKQGWYQADAGQRWMSQRGELEMAAPSQAGGQLRVTGHVSTLHTEHKPLRVRIEINGAEVAHQIIPQGVRAFDWTLPLPPDATGKPSMIVALEADRTVSVPNDSRAFGLLMGSLELVR